MNKNLARTLAGHKEVQNAVGSRNIWSATTTLYTNIFEGHVSEAEEASLTPYASGILHVTAEDVRWTYMDFINNPLIEAERTRSTQDNLKDVLDAGWIDKATLCAGVDATKVKACAWRPT